MTPAEILRAINDAATEAALRGKRVTRVAVAFADAAEIVRDLGPRGGIRSPVGPFQIATPSGYVTIRPDPDHPSGSFTVLPAAGTFTGGVLVGRVEGIQGRQIILQDSPDASLRVGRVIQLSFSRTATGPRRTGWAKVEDINGRYLTLEESVASCIPAAAALDYVIAIEDPWGAPAKPAHVDLVAVLARQAESAIADAIERETRSLWSRRLPDQYAMVREAVANHRAAPVDPLDVKHDGVPLRILLSRDKTASHERPCADRMFTPDQRAAVSAHWSAQLRAKVAASTAADKEREARRVLVDQEID